VHKSNYNLYENKFGISSGRIANINLFESNFPLSIQTILALFRVIMSLKIRIIRNAKKKIDRKIINSFELFLQCCLLYFFGIRK
jgi:hypothetical protein